MNVHYIISGLEHLLLNCGDEDRYLSHFWDVYALGISCILIDHISIWLDLHISFRLGHISQIAVCLDCILDGFHFNNSVIYIYIFFLMPPF